MRYFQQHKPSDPGLWARVQPCNMLGRGGVLLPATSLRLRPILKSIAMVTAFVFIFTSLLPAGWAWPSHESKTLRNQEPLESSQVKSGLEEVLKAEEKKQLSPPPHLATEFASLPATSTFWEKRTDLGKGNPQVNPEPTVGPLKDLPIQANLVKTLTSTLPSVPQAESSIPISVEVQAPPLKTKAIDAKIDSLSTKSGMEETPTPKVPLPAVSPALAEPQKPGVSRRDFLKWTIGGGLTLAGGLGLRELLKPIAPNLVPAVLTEPQRILISNPPGTIRQWRVGEPVPTFLRQDLPIRDMKLIQTGDKGEVPGRFTELEVRIEENAVKDRVAEDIAQRIGLVPTVYRPSVPSTIAQREAESYLIAGQQLLAHIARGQPQLDQWEAVRHPERWLAPPEVDMTLTLRDPVTLDRLLLNEHGAQEVNAMLTAIGHIKRVRPNQQVGLAYEIKWLLTRLGYEGITETNAEVLTVACRVIQMAQAQGAKVWIMDSATEWAERPHFGTGRNFILAALDTGLFDRERIYLDIEPWTTERWQRAVTAGDRRALKLYASEWLAFHEEEILEKVIAENRDNLGRTQLYTFVTPFFWEVMTEVERDRGRPIHPRIHPVLMSYDYPEGTEGNTMRIALQQAARWGRIPEAQTDRIELAVNMTPGRDQHLASRSAAELHQLVDQSQARSVVFNVRGALALVDLLKEGQLSLVQREPIDVVVGTMAEQILQTARQSVGLPMTRPIYEQQPRPEPKPVAADQQRFLESWLRGILWGVIGAAPLFHGTNTLLNSLRGEGRLLHPDGFPLGPEIGTLVKVISQMLGLLASGRVMIEGADLVLFRVDSQGRKIEGTQLEPRDILGSSSQISLPGVGYRGEIRLRLRRILPQEAREGDQVDWYGALSVSMAVQVAKGHQASGDTPKEEWPKIPIFPPIRNPLHPTQEELTRTLTLEVPALDPGPNWITVRGLDVNGEVFDLIGPGKDFHLSAQYAPLLAKLHLAWLRARASELPAEEARIRTELRGRLGREPYSYELEQALRSDLALAHSILEMSELNLLADGRGDVIARIPLEEISGILQKSEALRNFEARFRREHGCLPSDQDLAAANQHGLIPEWARLEAVHARLGNRLRHLKMKGATTLSVRMSRSLLERFYHSLLLSDFGIGAVDFVTAQELRDLIQISHNYGIRVGVEIDGAHLRELQRQPATIRREEIGQRRGRHRDTAMDLLSVIMESNDGGDWNLDFMALDLSTADAELRRRMEVFFRHKGMTLVVLGPLGAEGATSNKHSQYAANVATLDQIRQHLDTLQLEKPGDTRYAHAVAITGPDNGSIDSLVRWLDEMPRLGSGPAQERAQLEALYEERLKVPSKATLEQLEVRDPEQIRLIQEESRRAPHSLREAYTSGQGRAVAAVEAISAELAEVTAVPMVDRFGTTLDQARLFANGIRLTPMVYTGSLRPEVTSLVPIHMSREAGQPVPLGIRVRNTGNVVGNYDVHLFMSHPTWPGALHHISTLRLEPGQMSAVWLRVRNLPANDDVAYRMVVLPRGTEPLRAGMPSSITTDERALARVSGVIYGEDRGWQVHNDLVDNIFLFFERRERMVRLGYPAVTPEEYRRQLEAFMSPFATVTFDREGFISPRPLEGYRDILRRQVAQARTNLIAHQAEEIKLLEQIFSEKPKEGVQHLIWLARIGVPVVIGTGAALVAKGALAGYRTVRRRRAAESLRENQEERLKRAGIPQQLSENAAGLEEVRRIVQGHTAAFDLAREQTITTYGGAYQTADAISHPEQGKPSRALERGNKGFVGVANRTTQEKSEDIRRKPLTLAQRLRSKVWGAVAVTVAAAAVLPFWLIGTIGLAAGVAAAGVLLVALGWRAVARSPRLQNSVGWLLERPGAIANHQTVNNLFLYASGPLFLWGAMKVFALLGLSAVTTVSLPFIGSFAVPTMLLIGGITTALVLTGLILSGAVGLHPKTLSRDTGALGIAMIGTALILKLAASSLWAVYFWPAAIAMGLTTFALMLRLQGAPKPLAEMPDFLWSVGRLIVKWGAIAVAVSYAIFVVHPPVLAWWGTVAVGASLSAPSVVLLAVIGVLATVFLYTRFSLGRPQIQTILRNRSETTRRWLEPVLRGVVAVIGAAAIVAILPTAIAALGLPVTVSGALIAVGVLTMNLYLINKALNAHNAKPSWGWLFRIPAVVGVEIGAVWILLELAAAGVSSLVFWPVVVAIALAAPAVGVVLLASGSRQDLGDPHTPQQKMKAFWQLWLINVPLWVTVFAFTAAGPAGAVALAAWITYIIYPVAHLLLGWSALNAWIIQPFRFWVQRRFEKEEDRERTLRQAISYLTAVARMQGHSVTDPCLGIPPSELSAGELQPLFDLLSGTGALNLSPKDQTKLLDLFSRRRRTPDERAELYEHYDPAYFRQAWIEARSDARRLHVSGRRFHDPTQPFAPRDYLLSEDQMRLVNWHYWKLLATRESIEYLQPRVQLAEPSQLARQFLRIANEQGLTSEDRFDLLGSRLAEHLKAHADLVFSQDTGTVARTFWRGFYTGNLALVLRRFRDDDSLAVVMPALILSFGWDDDYTNRLFPSSPRRLAGESDMEFAQREEQLAAERLYGWWTFPIQILRVALLSYAVPIGFTASMVNRNLGATFTDGNTLNPLTLSGDAGVQGYLELIGWVFKVMGRCLEGHLYIMIRAILGKQVVRDTDEVLGSYQWESKHGTLQRHIDRLVAQEEYAAASHASLRGPRNVSFGGSHSSRPVRFFRVGWNPEEDGAYFWPEFHKGLAGVIQNRFDRPWDRGVTIYMPTGIEIDEQNMEIRLTPHPEKYAIQIDYQGRPPKSVDGDISLSWMEGFYTTVPQSTASGMEESQRKIRIGFESEEQRFWPELDQARHIIQDPADRLHGVVRQEGDPAARLVRQRKHNQRVEEKGLNPITAVSQAQGGFDMYKDGPGQRYQAFKGFARWVRERFFGLRIEQGQITRSPWRDLVAFGRWIRHRIFGQPIEPWQRMIGPVGAVRAFLSIVLPWAVTLGLGGVVFWFGGGPVLAAAIAFVPPVFGAAFGGLTPLSFIRSAKDWKLQGMKAEYDPDLLEPAMSGFFEKKLMPSVEEAIRGLGIDVQGRITVATYETLMKQGWALVERDAELRTWVMEYPFLMSYEHPVYKWLMDSFMMNRWSNRRARRNQILVRVEALINSQEADPNRRASLWRAFREVFTHNTEGKLQAIGNILAGIPYHRSRNRGVDRRGDVNSQFSVQGQVLLEALMAALYVPVGADRTWLRSSLATHFGGLRMPSMADPAAMQELLSVLQRWVEARDQLPEARGALRTELEDRMYQAMKQARELIQKRPAPMEAYFSRSDRAQTVNDYFSQKTFLQPDLESTQQFFIEGSKSLAQRLPNQWVTDRHSTYLSRKEGRFNKPAGTYLRAEQTGWSQEELDQRLQELRAHIGQRGTVQLTDARSQIREIEQWLNRHPLTADLLTLAVVPMVLFWGLKTVSWFWRRVRGESYSRDVVTLSALFGVTEDQVVRDVFGKVKGLKESVLDGLYDASEWDLLLGSYLFPGTGVARAPVYRRRGSMAMSDPVPFLSALLLLEEPLELAPASGFNRLPTDAFEIGEATAEDTLFGYKKFHRQHMKPTLNASVKHKKNYVFGQQELAKKNESFPRALQFFKGMGIEQAVRHLFDHPIFDDYREQDEARLIQRLFGWDAALNQPSGVSVFGMEAFRRDEVSVGHSRIPFTLLYGYTGFTGSPLAAKRVGPFAPGYVAAYWNYREYVEFDRLLGGSPGRYDGLFLTTLRLIQQELQANLPADRRLDGRSTPGALLKGLLVDPWQVLDVMAELIYHYRSRAPAPISREEAIQSALQNVRYELGADSAVSSSPASAAGLEEIQLGTPQPWVGSVEIGQTVSISLAIEDRKTIGRAVFFDPRQAVLHQVFNPEVISGHWDWRTIRGRLPQEQPGFSLARLISDPAQWGELSSIPKGFQLEMAMNSLQTNFWEPHGFLVSGGRLVAIPGITWSDNPWVFVLDAEHPGLRQVPLDEGRPNIAGIREAIVGPVLVSEGKDVSSEIKQYSPEAPHPNQVRWDPLATVAAFSAIGRTVDNRLIVLALAGQPEDVEKGIKQASVKDMAQAMIALGAIEAILLGGSMDVQQWVAGEDYPGILGRHNLPPHGMERPLNAALLVYAPVTIPAGLEESDVSAPTSTISESSVTRTDATPTEDSTHLQTQSPVNPPSAGLEEQTDTLVIDIQRDVAKIAAVLSARVREQTLVGIGPSGLKSDGPALIEFLDRLKDQVPALDPFLVVIGQEAPLYRDRHSVLLAAGGLEEAAGSLALLGAGRMGYLDTADGAEALSQILRARGVPITVAHLPLGDLTSVLKQILGNLAGLEGNLSQSEVESFYGVNLNKLADHLKELAQVGV